MIEVIISEDFLFCLVVILYILVHHHGSLIEVNMENTQEHFLPLLKSQFRSKNLLCKTESCNLCINNKYTTNEDNGPLIDLRNSKKLMQRLMIIILQEKLI